MTAGNSASDTPGRTPETTTSAVAIVMIRKRSGPNVIDPGRHSDSGHLQAPEINPGRVFPGQRPSSGSGN